MFGWLRLASTRASRSKRWRRFGLSATCRGNTLMATVRPSRVSVARYTSPIPPVPIDATISYGPRRWPGASRHKDRSDSVSVTVSACDTRKMSVYGPTRMVSPGSSTAGADRRTPRTKVPFLLSRSSIVARPSWTTMRAWRRDTLGESRQTVTAGSRPIRCSPSVNANVRLRSVSQQVGRTRSALEPCGASARRVAAKA